MAEPLHDYSSFFVPSFPRFFSNVTRYTKIISCMDTLPTEVLAHHLIPAVIGVHHRHYCLCDVREWQVHPPHIESDLFSRLRVHAKCLWFKAELMTCGCKFQADEYILEPNPKNKTKMDRMTHKEAAAVLDYNASLQQQYQRKGACQRCRFRSILALRRVNRRFRNAVHQSRPVRFVFQATFMHLPVNLFFDNPASHNAHDESMEQFLSVLSDDDFWKLVWQFMSY